MNIIYSERDVEVALRWCEVHSERLLGHLQEDGRLYELYDYLYEAENIAVHIHTLKENRLDPDRRIKIVVYLPPYKHDKFFSLILSTTYQISILRGYFMPIIGTKGLCHCGRLGKTHLLESDNGKCDNCYIYGFKRGEECAICKEDDGKPWLKTSCGHYFHDSCWYGIEENEMQVRKCPLCRSEQKKHTLTQL